MKYQLITLKRIIFFIINILILIGLLYLSQTLKDTTFLIMILIIVFIIECSIFLLYEYFTRYRFYNQLIIKNEKIKQKYLLANVIDEPSFQDGKITYDILYSTNKSMQDEINNMTRNQNEYIDYMEKWVHEIKTPIAGLQLLIDNNSDKKLIKIEINEIEDYVNQVLYYAKSRDLSEDIVLKCIDSNIIINEIIKKYARRFIYNNIKLIYNEDSHQIKSDPKLLSYIIEQVLSNAIKYCNKDNKVIEIKQVIKDDKLHICIIDNGIGISQVDIKSIFNKGYTGDNGRKHSQSTGMGLYIATLLANKLQIEIKVESQIDIGSRFEIILPQ